jgi:hypothetical protein
MNEGKARKEYAMHAASCNYACKERKIARKE